MNILIQGGTHTIINQYQIENNLSDQDMIDEFFNSDDLTVAMFGDEYYEVKRMIKNTLLAIFFYI